jgi:glucose-1-phosphate thymidylyltransferase
MKAVILAGGSGTRLYPLTRITNKHLLPLYDRPMISWAIEGVVKAGIKEVMLVTGGTHAGEFLRLLGNGHEYGIDLLTFAYQERPGGIAEALGLAKHFVGDECLLVMLADNVFGKCIKPSVDSYLNSPTGAKLLLSEVKDYEHLRHLGVPEFDGNKMVAIHEKPEDPPSSYCVTGVYMYEPSVFEVIKTLKPSARGELEITDVNNYYLQKGDISYDIVDGFWGDAGESIEAYWAVNDYVRKNGANL